MDESNFSHNLSSNLSEKKPSFDAHKGLIVAIGFILVFFGIGTFFQHKFDFITKLPFFSRNISKDVLAAYDIVPYTQLQSNLKYVFNNSAEVLNGMRIRGDVDADGSNVTLGEGTIIASNIIYSLIAGDGITITPGQNPTISVTNPTSSGVTSIEDISGAVDLIAGSNISLSTDGNKITINSTSSGADGNTTYSAGEGLALTGTTFSVDYNGIGLSDLGTSNTTSGASVIGVYSGNFTNIMVASPGTDLQTVLEAIDAELSVSGGGGISAVGNIANGNAFTSGVPGSNLFIADTGWIGLGGAAGRIYFDDSGTDTISFLNANIGIGTSAPQFTLDVAGNIRAGTDIYIGSVALGQTGGASVLGVNSSSITYSSANNIQQVLEDLDTAINNFGVGGSGPWLISGNYAYLNPSLATYLGNNASGGTNKLSGAYFSDGSLVSLGTDNDYRLVFDGNNLLLGDTSNTFLSVGDSGTTGNFNFNNNQFYIRGDGNIGIGSTAPIAKLDVRGNISTSDNYQIGGTTILGYDGYQGTKVGFRAGETMPIGADYNTLVGYGAGRAINNTNSDNNTLIGTFSGSVITSGYENTIIGSNAGLSLTSGFGNTLLGEYTGVGSTSSYNLILGKSAGTSNNAGNYNVMLGAYAQVSSYGHHSILIGGDANTTFSSSIGIGYNADPTAANQLLIGGNDADGFINDAYFGRGVVSATPNDITFNATGGSGSNISGANFRLAGGKGTGNADGGDILFLTSDSGPSGSSLQTITEKMRLTDEGNLVIGATAPIAGMMLDVAGNIRAGTDIYIGSIALGATGGASVLGFNDLNNTLTYVDASTIQNAIEDLNSAIGTIASGTSVAWTDGGSFLFPTNDEELGNSGVGTTGKLYGIYMADNSAITFGTDNDFEIFYDQTNFLIQDGTNAFLAIGDSGTTGNFNFNNNQVYIRGDGRLGIGTTNPQEKFEVSNNGEVYARIVNTLSTGAAGINLNSGNAYSLIFTNSQSQNEYGGANSLNLYGGPNSPIAFLVNDNPAPAMFINTAGNVGIGTTAPTANMKLDVVGNIRAGTDIYIGSIALGGTGGSSVLGFNDLNNTLTYVDASTVQNAIEDLDAAMATLSGSAGLWTDGGSFLFPTGGDYLGNIAVGGTGKINGLFLGDSAPIVFGTDNDIYLKFDGTKLTVGDTTNTFLAVGDSGTTGNFNFNNNQMYIRGDGNVGIGTTAPAYKLDISGTARTWDLISQNISLSSLSTNIINAFGGFDGYTNFTGGIGTGGIGKDSITGAQRLTADGNLTNIGTYQGGQMHLSSGGTFATKVDYTSGTEPFGIAIGDINGDNVSDVISANLDSDSISVFINNGNGTLATKVDYAATNGPYTPEIGDLNGDGIADLAVINFSSDFLSVYINNGDGTFATKVDYAAAGGQSRGLSIGDVNGDGKNDLVVASGDADTVSIYLNNGNGTFATKVDYTTGDFPNSVTLGDVDGDSKLDIVTANYFGNNMSVLINNGNGTFATKVDYATGLTAYDSIIADFDGDRNPDIAISNYSSNTISVFINDGDGTFAAKVDYVAGSVPNRLATADVNGDGYADIAVTNRDGNTISVFINDGDGTFAAKVDYATGTGPTAIKLGDLNGDGKSDIATANWSSNTVSVLMNNVSTMLYAQASTGRIGIGTTAPTSGMKLDVAGNIRAGTDVYIGNIALGSTGGAGLIGVNTAGFTFSTAPTVQGQLTALNTGIGTTAYSSTNYVTAGSSLGASIGTLDSAIRNLAIGNSGLWRDTNGATPGGNVYLGDTTSNFAIGGTNSNAPFYVSPVLGASINVGSTAAFTIGNTANDIFTFNTDINAGLDLFSLNVPSGTSNIANLFAIYDNGSPVFSVSQSQIESAVPHVFSAAGDVSIAYDLIFSNETSSNIKSNGPLTIESGEVFENNDLTLRTFGTGNIILETNTGNLKVAGGSIIGGTYMSLGMTSPLNGLLVEGRVAIGATAPTANMTLDVAGNIRAGTDVYIGSIRLGATGTTNLTSGAGKIGLYNEFSYIGVGSSTVQDGLDDLDSAIGNLIIGSSGLWLDGGNYTYLNTTYTSGNIGNTTPGGANKISGLFLTDTAPVWFGLDNDFKMQFNTTNLSIGDSSNNFLTIADSGTLGTLTFNTDDFYVSGTNSRVGIGTASPLGVLDVRGDIFTDRWLLSATNTGVGSSVYGGGALAHSAGNEGWYNTAFGANALYSNTTGFMNSAFGQQAGYQNTTGDSNIAIGHQSLVFNQTGDKNVAIGVLAGYGVSTNSYSDNTLIGYSTGYSLTTSTGRNTLIGSQAGDQITSGTGNIVIGYNIDAPSATGNNQLNIGGLLMGTLGVGATINGNAVLGSSGSSAHTILGTVTAATIYNTTVGVTNRDLFVDNTGVIGYVSSSQRYKEEINYLNDVDWLYNLRPVDYVYKNDSTKALQYGLIAEEVNKINPLLVSYNEQGLPETVTYSKLITPLLKAVQDQRSTLTSLSNDFATLALPEVDSFVNIEEFDGLENEFNKLEETQTAQQSEIIAIQSQVQDLMNRIDLTEPVASEESKIDNLTDRVSFLEQMLFGKEASSSAELAELINNTNEYPDGEVLGIEDGKLTVEDLTVTGKTNLFDLGVVGDMSVGQIVVRGNEAAINSLALPLEIQSNATAPIQFMAGKVVIDTDGNVIVKKEVTAKKYNVDTTNKESASIGKGSIKVGETEVIIKSTSVTGNSNIFLTPTVETDVPLAVVEKIAGNYFKVKIVKEAEEDISFNWWIVN